MLANNVNHNNLKGDHLKLSLRYMSLYPCTVHSTYSMEVSCPCCFVVLKMTTAVGGSIPEIDFVHDCMGTGFGKMCLLTYI